jgi:hypothetical protein
MSPRDRLLHLRTRVHPANRGRIPELALAFGVLLAAGCGVATVCPKSPTGAISLECLGTSLTSGDRLRVRTQDEKPVEGIYLRTTAIAGEPALVLLEGTGSVFDTNDTLLIRLTEIREVARHRQASPFVAGFVVGSMVASAVLLVVTALTWAGID